jgi:membrane protein YqaA with SNARE-associated domain
VSSIVRSVYWFFAALGPFGLLGLGILDSSILFMPMGNDLLIVALTARKPGWLPLYVFMAAAGSTLGSLLTDIISRKGGEAGLERRVPRRRLEYVKAKVRKHAGKAIALATIMPPPFPFTPVIAAAAALQYPRKWLIAVVAAGRVVRFTAVGLLAIWFGKRILRMAEEPVVQTIVLAILAISIIGSAASIASWVRRSRLAGRRGTGPVLSEPAHSAQH